MTDLWTYAAAASRDAAGIQPDEGGSQPTPPLQLSDACGLIREEQLTFFTPGRVIGAFRGALTVREMRRDKANAIIRERHYSHKVYAASTIHLGVYWHGELVGVLQYGFAMNPASQGSVVADTALDEYLELNRMWVDDRMPRNTETAAIAQSLHYIRTAHPNIAWIQSFADERCQRLGVVYQAASFLYCGEHTTAFYELDGVVYHKSLAERDPSLAPAAAFLQANIERAVRTEYRQFRYIKFLKRGWRSRLLLPVRPYPKPEGLAA